MRRRPVAGRGGALFSPNLDIMDPDGPRGDPAGPRVLEHDIVMKRLVLLSTAAAVLSLATGCGDGTNPEYQNATAPPTPPADLQKMFMKPEKGKGAAKKAAAAKAGPEAAAPPAQ
jgi:hypothetical protein